MVSGRTDNAQVLRFEREALPYVNDLFRTAHAMMCNQAAAEAVVEETCLAASKTFHRFTPGTNCRAWLFSALFRTISQHRRKWFSTRVMLSVPDAAEPGTDEETLAAFRKIPQQFAEVVMLADVQEFTYAQIEEILDIPIGTVISRLRRGRQLMRMQMATHGAEVA